MISLRLLAAERRLGSPRKGRTVAVERSLCMRFLRSLFPSGPFVSSFEEVNKFSTSMDSESAKAWACVVPFLGTLSDVSSAIGFMGRVSSREGPIEAAGFSNLAFCDFFSNLEGSLIFLEEGRVFPVDWICNERMPAKEIQDSEMVEAGWKKLINVE